MSHGIPLVTPESRVILDIDLDFFGCDSPAVSIINAGMPFRVLEVLQQEVLKLHLCAAHPSSPDSSKLVLDTDAEQRADQLLRIVAMKMASGDDISASQLETEMDLHVELLQAVTNDTEQCEGLVEEATTKRAKYISSLKGQQRMWYERVTHTPRHLRMLPHPRRRRRKKEPDTIELRRELALAFSQAAERSSQLRKKFIDDGDKPSTGVLMAGFRELAKYGACIDTEEYPRISFKVGLCVGSSDSDDERTGRIQIHHPDRAEIEEAKLTFTRILEKLGESAPLMVTLCRSMRDGYAPRAYWQEVETSVLNAVGQMAQRTSSTSQVVYDRNLYYGKDGYQWNDHT